MKFGLAIISTPEVENKIEIINSLSDDLRFFFKNKDYGNDVKSYTIGVHCQNVPPGFEKFSKLPKPSYTKGKKTINPDGIPFTLEDSFEHSIKLDFETFKNSSEIEAEKYLAQEIIKSLDIIETMKAKIKDFDSLTFRTDLENYFKEKNLI
ncbi:hypothetical protein [Flavobacterium sp. N1736]|uniref:hypothetical protein n=1 Tax=Flavobacterium sp. N1736 TaxID=2986823 RepID=UPI0022256AE1|nr:hypothetical protein [Flavobacterium sp. N1736]